MRARHSLVAAVLCTLLSACQPDTPINTKIPKPATYEIAGFVPIEDKIPDWESVRRKPMRRLGLHDDGHVSNGTGPDRFLCRDNQQRYFKLDTSDPQKLKPQVVDMADRRSPATPSPELRVHLDAILDEYMRFYETYMRNPDDPQLGRGFDIDALHSRRIVPPNYIKTFEDGWLLGTDLGEFGGGLFWINRDGDLTELDTLNVTDMIKHEGQILTAHGISHMVTNEGHISVIKKRGKRFKIKTIAADVSIEKMALMDNTLVGISRHGLTYIKDGEVAAERDWPYNDPLGFVQTDVGFLPWGDVYVGGNNIIAVYNDLPNINRPAIYIPEDCTPIFEITTDYRTK